MGNLALVANDESLVTRVFQIDPFSTRRTARVINTSVRPFAGAGET